MSDLRSFKIGDKTYKMAVMPPWSGASFAAEVSSLLAGALGGEAVEAKTLSGLAGGNVSDEFIAKAASMVMRLLPHIDSKEFTKLARRCFIESQVTAPDGSNLGEEGLFDDWFGRNRGDYFPVAIWAIKENCSGFFAGGGMAWSALAGLFMPSKFQKTE